MLHHLSFAVVDLERSASFYDAALAPLGYVRAWTHETADGYKEAAVGYGIPGADDEFAIRARRQGVVVPSEGFHIAFTAPSREAVTAFYRAALDEGGRDNGGVGLHPEHGPDYFAAFVFDPDEHRIEAVVAERPSQAMQRTVVYATFHKFNPSIRCQALSVARTILL